MRSLYIKFWYKNRSQCASCGN